MNVIARLEYELAYYDSAVHRFNHYTTRTPPQEFVRVIFLNKCWVMDIPFVGMVKFKFLAHFPVYHLAHPVVSSLVLLLRQFAAFAYHMIDGIIIIIIIIIIPFLRVLHVSVSLWSLSLRDSKSPQVFRTLLGILAYLNNAAVGMVSILLLIPKSSSLFFQAFEDCSKCTEYNWYHRHPYLHSFFSSLARSKYMFIFLLSYIFTLVLLEGNGLVFWPG